MKFLDTGFFIDNKVLRRIWRLQILISVGAFFCAFL